MLRLSRIFLAPTHSSHRSPVQANRLAAETQDSPSALPSVLARPIREHPKPRRRTARGRVFSECFRPDCLFLKHARPLSVAFLYHKIRIAIHTRRPVVRAGSLNLRRIFKRPLTRDVDSLNAAQHHTPITRRPRDREHQRHTFVILAYKPRGAVYPNRARQYNCTLFPL